MHFSGEAAETQHEVPAPPEPPSATSALSIVGNLVRLSVDEDLHTIDQLNSQKIPLAVLFNYSNVTWIHSSDPTSHALSREIEVSEIFSQASITQNGADNSIEEEIAAGFDELLNV